MYVIRIYNIVVRNSLVGARVVVLILGSDPNQVGFTNSQICVCAVMILPNIQK